MTASLLIIFLEIGIWIILLLCVEYAIGSVGVLEDLSLEFDKLSREEQQKSRQYYRRQKLAFLIFLILSIIVFSICVYVIATYFDVFDTQLGLKSVP